MTNQIHLDIESNNLNEALITPPDGTSKVTWITPYLDDHLKQVWNIKNPKSRAMYTTDERTQRRKLLILWEGADMPEDQHTEVLGWLLKSLPVKPNPGLVATPTTKKAPAK
jgi:hypothetical protein